MAQPQTLPHACTHDLRAAVCQVIPGPTNGTAYVINACDEGFYYTGGWW